MRHILFALTVAILGVFPAHAVLIAEGDGAGNDTGVGAGDGWNYVGGVNASSAVYLGVYGDGYWVLTAEHVGVGDFYLDSVLYTHVPDSGIQIGNTDLLVYRISTDPGLPNLALSTESHVGDAVKMIGHGRNREVPMTAWYVDTATRPYIWSETWFPEADEVLEGYKYGPGASKRWGDNVIDGAFYSPGLQTSLLQTHFLEDDGFGTQAVHGDSGGGMFYDTGSGWELAGVILDRDYFHEQPLDSVTFGNGSYMADISIYRDDILAAIPEPSVGVLVLSGALIVWVRRRQR